MYIESHGQQIEIAWAVTENTEKRNIHRKLMEIGVFITNSYCGCGLVGQFFFGEINEHIIL